MGVGSVVAAGFLIFGLLNNHFGLMAVAVVVYLLGQTELAHVRAQARVRNGINGSMTGSPDHQPASRRWHAASPAWSGMKPAACGFSTRMAMSCG